MPEVQLVISEYDPRWPGIFQQLRDSIALALGDLAAGIEHVGSTSVPGLAAKPIVDLDVLLRSSSDLSEAIQRLATIDYEYEGDKGIVGRHAFRRRAARPAHHLYVCEPQFPEFARHLAFRNYLRAHPHEALAYAQFKKTLLPRFRYDRAGYQNAKDAFVRELLQRALKCSDQGKPSE